MNEVSEVRRESFVRAMQQIQQYKVGIVEGVQKKEVTCRKWEADCTTVELADFTDFKRNPAIVRYLEKNRYLEKRRNLEIY